MYSVSVAYPAKTDRNSILAAALAQVEEEGVEQLAIRAVAARLGLAPNALYRYFDNLAALEAAVAEESRLQVLQAMQKAVCHRDQPDDAIQALAEAYIRFAQKRPRVFALYLKTSGGEIHTPQCLKNTEFFLEHVTKVYGKDRAWEAAHALWAFLHGAAVLLEAGVVPAKNAISSLSFGLRLWIDGASGPHR